MKLELLESRHLLSDASNGQIEIESDSEQSNHPDIKSTHDASDNHSHQHTTHSTDPDLWSSITKDPLTRASLLLGFAAGLTADQLYMKNARLTERISVFLKIFSCGLGIALLQHKSTESNKGQTEIHQSEPNSIHTSSDNDPNQHTANLSNLDALFVISKNHLVQSGLLIGLAAGFTIDHFLLKRAGPINRISIFLGVVSLSLRTTPIFIE